MKNKLLFLFAILLLCFCANAYADIALQPIALTPSSPDSLVEISEAEYAQLIESTKEEIKAIQKLSNWSIVSFFTSLLTIGTIATFFFDSDGSLFFAGLIASVLLALLARFKKRKLTEIIKDTPDLLQDETINSGYSKVRKKIVAASVSATLCAFTLFFFIVTLVGEEARMLDIFFNLNENFIALFALLCVIILGKNIFQIKKKTKRSENDEFK